ncbi:hypothetical protein FRC12_009004 [Ceratobasidium sp. 428]|nr:hypothetical protein FRC09_015551 [Ceratobasidium sp. 395]KAG8791516.1 hypothetical protein FRC12_009004 [Ceratobasidium sp. 428]
MSQSAELADTTARLGSTGGEPSAADNNAEERDAEGDEEGDDVAALYDWKEIKEDIATLIFSDGEVNSDEN